MTPEERLRELLQEEAELLVPVGDGLAVIRDRVRVRRSWRRLQPLLGVVAATAVVVTGTVGTSLTDRNDREPRTEARELPRPEPSAPAEDCADGGDVLCADEGPGPDVPRTSGVTTTADGTPFWPFTNDREATAWARDPGARGWAADARQTAQHLVDDHLQLRGLVAGTAEAPTGPGPVRVELRAGTASVGTVTLVQVGGGAPRPWSVTAVEPTGDPTVLAPVTGQRVGSPLAVTGSSVGPVDVVLRTSAGTALGQSTATAGDWSVPVDWSSLAWSTGSVTVTSRTAGTLTGLAVVAVRRAGAAGPGVPPAATTFLAVDRGVVVLHDATTGQRLRQLSFPPPGAVDSSPSRGGEGAVFVRRRPDRCSDLLVRVSLGSGAAGVTVPSGNVRREQPAVSPDGRLLAWVERPCTDDVPGPGSGDLVVRGPDARERRMPLATERTDLGGLAELGIRDDGAVVLEKSSGGVSTLAPDASSVDQAVAVDGRPDCPDSAPAWSGRDLFLWRGCDGPQVGLLLAGPDFGSGLQNPSEQVTGVRSTAVAQGDDGPVVLVGLGGRDGAGGASAATSAGTSSVGPVARLVDGRLVTLFANSGCSTSTGACLTEPTW